MIRLSCLNNTGFRAESHHSVTNSSHVVLNKLTCKGNKISFCAKFLNKFLRQTKTMSLFYGWLSSATSKTTKTTAYSPGMVSGVAERWKWILQRESPPLISRKECSVFFEPTELGALIVYYSIAPSLKAILPNIEYAEKSKNTMYVYNHVT